MKKLLRANKVSEAITLLQLREIATRSLAVRGIDYVIAKCFVATFLAMTHKRIVAILLAIALCLPAPGFALAPFHDGANIRVGEEQAQKTRYVDENLDWFLETFDSYRADDILSDAGIILLEQARQRKAGDRDQSEFIAELYRVMQYFRDIPAMTKEKIFEQFPEQYFRRPRPLPTLCQEMDLVLVGGCHNLCPYCPIQPAQFWGKKLKCMPYPLVVMLMKQNGQQIRYRSIGYEPLFYKDASGALFDDVMKLFYVVPRIVTHGHVMGQEAVALENIKRMNESGRKYHINISIHVMDVDYFKLKKQGQTDSEIADHYAARFIALAEQFSDHFRFYISSAVPPEAVDQKYLAWRTLIPAIEERVLAALQKGGIRDVYRQSPTPRIFDAGSVRGLQTLGPSLRGKMFSKEVLASGTLSREVGYTIGPDGLLYAWIAPELKPSKGLLSRLTPEAKKEVMSLTFIGYRNLLMDLSALNPPGLSAILGNNRISWDNLDHERFVAQAAEEMEVLGYPAYVGYLYKYPRLGAQDPNVKIDIKPIFEFFPMGDLVEGRTAPKMFFNHPSSVRVTEASL